MEEVAPPSFFAAEYPLQSSIPDISQNLCCPICMILLDRPVELGCGSIVCLSSCTKWIHHRMCSSLLCPCCYSDTFDNMHIRPPPAIYSRNLCCHVMKFATLFEVYGKCHQGLNSSSYVCDSDIDKLGMLIDTNSSVNTVVLIYNFREGDRRVPTIYRAKFPWATVLPKMHILEDNTIPWLRRHHVGAGLMGGQGAESIHAHLMRPERIYQGIARDVDRLKYILKEHELESAPSLTCLRPPPAKRQKNESFDEHR